MVKFVNEDGRCFTDFRPNCQINNKIQTGSGQMNEREYRMYLQHNAAKMIEQNRMRAQPCDTCLCPKCGSYPKRK